MLNLSIPQFTVVSISDIPNASVCLSVRPSYPVSGINTVDTFGQAAAKNVNGATLTTQQKQKRSGRAGNNVSISGINTVNALGK